MGLRVYVYLCCVAVSLAEDVVDRPVVQTTAGPIQGETFEYPSGRLSRYLGVPYGRPPGGSLRFSAPQTPEPWTDTLDTTAFPNRCYQMAYLSPDPEISEDCLYLNVHVPLPPAAVELKAVMVWIHGGALVVGSGSEYPLEALTLAGDVIAISINYRLDVFGFIATEDDRAPGNVGFLDQVLALRWVQDNIAAFGGDPDKVTIFGESAGGWSVNAHMVSPLSRGLFTRAISQSGSLYGYTLETREERAERTRGLAASLDCPSTPEADMLTCLQDVPADKLLKAATEAQFLLCMAGPVTVGGDFLPRSPTELWEEHHVAPGVDYMLGANSEEGLVVLWRFPYDDVTHHLKHGAGPEDPIFDFLLRCITDWSPSHTHLVDTLSQTVRAQYLPDLGDRLGVIRGLLDAVADRMFVAATLGAASKMAETDQKVYLYYFDQVTPPEVNIPYPNLRGAPELGLGAAHAFDIYYVLGWPLVDGVPHSLATEMPDHGKAISRSMVATWTNFAKTGNMTVLLDDGSEMEWPQYDKTTQSYLRWKYPMTSSSLETRLRPRADSFWNVLMPALLEKKSRPLHRKAVEKDEL